MVPQGIFGAKSIFRLCLFLDMSIMILCVVGCYLWRDGQVVKIDGLIFLDILGGIYF